MTYVITDGQLIQGCDRFNPDVESTKVSEPPTSSITVAMPAEERKVLLDAMAQAKVILEYGAGGSTIEAAKLPGKFVISVESDRRWAEKVQAQIDSCEYWYSVVMHFVDIGETGLWGRPVDYSSWQKFHRYPLEVWSAPFFRQPDLVIIDGRFRTACMGAVLMNARKTTRVLFDDYIGRPSYRTVEEFVKPFQITGRLAEFIVQPDMIGKDNFSSVVSLFSQATVAGQKDAYKIKG